MFQEVADLEGCDSISWEGNADVKGRKGEGRIQDLGPGSVEK